MRTSMLAALCLVLVAATACRGDSSAPSPTATAAGTAAASAASASASATRSAQSSAAITAANAGSLREVASAAARDAQRLVWSLRGALWLVGTRAVDEVDPATGASRRVFEAGTSESVLAVSPAGVIATTAGGNAPVRLINLANSQILRTLEPGEATSAAVFFANRIGLVASDRVGVSLWDVATGQRAGELGGFTTAAPVYNVTLANDGRWVAWISRGTFQFSEMASGAFGPRTQFEDAIAAYAFSPDGRAFATARPVQAGGGLTGQVQLWDPAAGEPLLRISLPSAPSTIAFSPAQPLLATGGDGGYALWSTADGKQLGGVDAPRAGKVRLAAFSPDGATLATVDQGERPDDPLRLRLWRAGS